jgi:peroxiredoxin
MITRTRIVLLFGVMLLSSCTKSVPETQGLKRVPDVIVRTVQGDTVRLSHYYTQAPVLLSVYLGVGCPMCVMSMKQLSQHTLRIKSYGWNVLALSNDAPEDNREALEKPNFDSSFVQAGGNFAVELLSDSDHLAMEMLGCYRRKLDTERHGMFLIDREGYIRFEAIDRRPYEQWQVLIDSMKALNSLEKISGKGFEKISGKGSHAQDLHGTSQLGLK